MNFVTYGLAADLGVPSMDGPIHGMGKHTRLWNLVLKVVLLFVQVQPEVEDLEQGPQETGRGRLQYSLEYNFRAQEVRLLQGCALAESSGAQQDPGIHTWCTSAPSWHTDMVG